MLPFHCCPNRACTLRLLRAAALCALLMSNGGLSAAAQTLTSGGLRVHVLGPGTTLPPGTSVQLQPDDAASGQAVSLGRDGWATALQLTPGTYQVRAEMLGVALSCTESISVDAGSVTDVLLDTAARPAPSCRSSGAPWPPFSLERVSNASLAAEPAEGVDSAARDATLAGAPATESEEDDTDATSASREESQLGAAGPSLAGLSPAANTTLVDGLSATQGFQGIARVAAEGTPRAGPSFGATVRSFRSLPRTFSAQYGGAGGVLAVTSPEHADRLHGTAFLLERGSALSASNPFSLVTHYGNGVPSTVVVKPADTLVEAGASGGIPLAAMRGPLQHASLFGSLEAQLRNRQIVSTPATPGFFTLTAEPERPARQSRCLGRGGDCRP